MIARGWLALRLASVPLEILLSKTSRVVFNSPSLTSFSRTCAKRSTIAMGSPRGNVLILINMSTMGMRASVSALGSYTASDKEFV